MAAMTTKLQPMRAMKGKWHCILCDVMDRRTSENCCLLLPSVRGSGASVPSRDPEFGALTGCCRVARGHRGGATLTLFSTGGSVPIQKRALALTHGCGRRSQITCPHGPLFPLSLQFRRQRGGIGKARRRGGEAPSGRGRRAWPV